MPFCITTDFYNKTHSEKKRFYCPACGSSLRWTESELDIINKKLIEKETELKNTQRSLNQEKESKVFWLGRSQKNQRRINSLKGAITKLKKKKK